jgi:hypothetical protein
MRERRLHGVEDHEPGDPLLNEAGVRARQAAPAVASVLVISPGACRVINR